MSEATEKQISYATSLGIENASGFTKEALKELINAKVGGDKPNFKPKAQPQASMGHVAATQGISEVEHRFQSEYEFGPAGNRHKIKYFTLEELKQKFKELEEAGFFVEQVKV